MVALPIFIAFFVLLDIAVLLDRVPDTRDPEFSLGRLSTPHPASEDKGR